MHDTQITSYVNSSNSYCIQFNANIEQDKEHNIGNIVNYIRLNYKINNCSYIAEYDNIEHDILNLTTSTITYKLLLTKLNNKLKLIPPNTACELIVYLSREIDDPELSIC